MIRVTDYLIIIFIGSALGGCVRGVQPTLHELDLEKSDNSRIRNLVLTQRVVVERGKKKVKIYSSEKTTEVASTSKFGKEHEIANVDCIVTGLQDVLSHVSLISSSAFWETVGKDTDTLHLTSLFDEPHSLAIKQLDLDFLVVAYHQRIDVESFFMEAYVEGGVTDEDRENAAAVIVDVKNERVVGAIEVGGTHLKILAHVVIVIPLWTFSYPEEDLCRMAGRISAEEISKNFPRHKAPTIAVVAAKNNPYSAFSGYTSTLDARTTAETVKDDISNTVLRHIPPEELRNKAKQGDNARQGEPEAQLQLYYNLVGQDRAAAHRWLCKSADAGHPDARYRLALLYENGMEGVNKNNVRAYLWYTLAAESGSYWGGRHAIRLRNEHLTAQALIEAEDAVQKWRPGHCEFGLGLGEKD